VKPREAIGRVSAEFVTPYPPGVPVINFGEVLSEEIVTYLEEFVEAGGFVEGASDPTLQRLRVAT
jgi:arginine/lysine/ornithine decarboxylase